MSTLSNIWNDVLGEPEKLYAVQTNTKVVERCILMTTDPGDLVSDPTCVRRGTRVLAPTPALPAGGEGVAPTPALPVDGEGACVPPPSTGEVRRGETSAPFTEEVRRGETITLVPISCLLCNRYPIRLCQHLPPEGHYHNQQPDSACHDASC